MSTYSDASLIFYPSGYKESKLYSLKPTDGSGDLTFTRASSATRVNAEGLIEGVRTNLLTYSEQFDDAAWSKTNCTITANDTTAPDGTLTADRITATSSGQSLTQFPTLTSGQPFVFSVFVKEGNWGIVRIGNASSATNGAWFNVTNGTAGTINGGTSEIIDYGNGWYRLIAKFTSFSSGISFIALSNADGSTTTSAIDTFMYLWGAQIETGGIATEYIPTTTTAVSVGITNNVPRIDYTGGGCGKLLLEPQRTNLFFPSSNSSTNFTLSNTSFLASQINGLSGTLSGALISETVAASNHYYGLTGGISVTSGTAYTFSVYLKKGNGGTAPDIIQLTFNFGGFGGVYANFNISTGIVTLQSGVVATISEVVNGYYRCSITATATSTNASTGAIIGFANNNPTSSRLPSYVGLTTSNFFYDGLQLESGSYPTSYIPTSGTAVTRVKDLATFATAIAPTAAQDKTIAIKTTISNVNSSFPLLGQIGSSPQWLLVGSVLYIYTNAGFGNWDLSAANLKNGNSHTLALRKSGSTYTLYADGISYGDKTIAGDYIASQVIGTGHTTMEKMGVSFVYLSDLALPNADLTLLTGTLGETYFESYALMANYLNYTIQ